MENMVALQFPLRQEELSSQSDYLKRAWNIQLLFKHNSHDLQLQEIEVEPVFPMFVNLSMAEDTWKANANFGSLWLLTGQHAVSKPYNRNAAWISVRSWFYLSDVTKH